MQTTQTLGPLLPVLGLALGAVVLLTLLRGLIGAFGPPAPVAKPFMTRRERAMLVAIEQVLPMYRIHAQVAMGALLTIPYRPGRRPMLSDRNAFAQKIVDFVVEDPATGMVVALIEVDDAWHCLDRDRKRDAMTARAGYRTLRVPAMARPSVSELFRIVGFLREERL